MSQAGTNRSEQMGQEWWDSLRHGGMLLTPEKVAELDQHDTRSHLNPLARRLWLDAQGKTKGSLNALVDQILGTDLGWRESGEWLSGNQVPLELSKKSILGATIKPARLWKPSGSELQIPVFVDSSVSRIGLGRGVHLHSQALEWLRGFHQPFAVIVSLDDLRLVSASVESEAWAEWAFESWFHAGGASPQIRASELLLRSENFLPKPTSKYGSLHALIELSRKGQAEISAVLGEQVRKAIEALIQDFPGLKEATEDPLYKLDRQSIYIAATRIVMRLITVLFAEARGLLPVSNINYFESYSLAGLKVQLQKRGLADLRSERLKLGVSSWPRLLSLFRLLYQGSSHPELTMPSYSGDLFMLGNVQDRINGVSRALAFFENSLRGPSDATVDLMIRSLTQVKKKIRSRGGTARVSVPVNFSDLSSEYIGILYEGVLDYELQKAPSDTPVVFLNVGDQPAIPLSRLEEMGDDEIKKLFENFKKSNKKSDESDDEEEDLPAEEEPEEDSEDDLTDPEADEAMEPVEAETPRALAERRALEFSKRAVLALRLVRAGRRRGAEVDLEAEVLSHAKRLLREVVPANDWYIVRWGGTRKGGGTFYTRPQLAIPTVRRTLEPLVYQDESLTRLKAPEALLGLRICDPAMGSGSFLVSATRYLSRKLFESVMEHGRLTVNESGKESSVTLIPAMDGEEALIETVGAIPGDPYFESMLLSRLKRWVVDHCIYGVDIDALAVELARLAIWIETMDRSLPFEFLDHRLKVGNALVGASLAQVKHYPYEALFRATGDEKRTAYFHYEPKVYSKKLKEVRDDQVKPQMERFVESLYHGEFSFMKGGADISEALKRVRQGLRKIRRMPLHQAEERKSLYESFMNEPDVRGLKTLLDAWCAIWFWDLSILERTPLPREWPKMDTETTQQVESLSAHPMLKFFHWELEFPEVFFDRQGFDAILGNPPWDTSQPMSKEYFSNIDPLYRAYSKQEGLRVQRLIFEKDRGAEEKWLEYCATFEGLNHWFASIQHFTGSGDKPRTLGKGRSGDKTRSLWEGFVQKDLAKAGYLHRFEHQGEGKSYTYRLFLDAAHRLLKPDGVLGFIVPSGIYSDSGSKPLRELFLDQCRWHWLFGFENRNKIFDIHRSFKFCPIIVQKGGETESIRVAFMRHDLEEWENAEIFVMTLPKARISKFSPKLRSILEIQHPKDLDILEKVYFKSGFLGSDGPDSWDLKCTQGDFSMTSDSHLFVARDKAEAEGFVSNKFGIWVHPDGRKLLPLYQGVMLGHMDFSKKGWENGRGRYAKWRDIPWENKVFEPQWLVELQDVLAAGISPFKPRFGFMYIVSSTNQRTFIGSPLAPFPTGNMAPFFSGQKQQLLVLAPFFNSFVFDFVVRRRISGLHLSYGQMEEFPLPKMNEFMRTHGASLSALCRAIIFRHPSMVFWQSGLPVFRLNTAKKVKLARAVIDCLVANYFEFSVEDLQWILKGCDLDSLSQVSDSRDPRGFWRVDQDLEPKERLTNIILYLYRTGKYQDLIFDFERDGLEEHSEKEGDELSAQLGLNDENIKSWK